MGATGGLQSSQGGSDALSGSGGSRLGRGGSDAAGGSVGVLGSGGAVTGGSVGVLGTGGAAGSDAGSCDLDGVLVNDACLCPGGAGTAVCDRLDYQHIVSGKNYTCVLRSDGSVLCFGLDSVRQVSSTPKRSGFVELRAGGVTTCALEKGVPFCWGWAQNGLTTSPPGPFRRLMMGWNAACATSTANGAATYSCWGVDDHQEISGVPASPVLDLAIGWQQACAIALDGSVQCWGANDMGQATPPAGHFVQLSLASWHSCALRDNGTIACWGAVPSWPTDAVESISSHGLDSCAIRKRDHHVVCWGLGAANTAPDIEAAEVAVGDGHACALPRDVGSLRCWGALPWTTNGP